MNATRNLFLVACLCLALAACGGGAPGDQPASALEGFVPQILDAAPGQPIRRATTN